jgi:hypothetical protein
MKLRLFLLALASSLALCASATAVPIFNATLTMGKDHRFVLVSEGGASSSWLKLGDVFENYTLKAYDVATSTLDLEREGKVTKVKLVSDASVANAPMPTKATLADAEDVFRVMRFDEMMKKVMDGQKKAMAPMMAQGMAQGVKGLNLSPEDQAALSALQAKIMDRSLSAITSPEMRSAMAQIYSDVFSKEELNSMSAFYGTPGGQALIDKQPEVQQKMMGVMMPMIMQSQQASQKEMRDFMVALKAKNAPAPGATPAPEPTKP